MTTKKFFGFIAFCAVIMIAFVFGSGCGGSSSHSQRGGSDTASKTTIPLNFNNEESFYEIFTAEYEGWNCVDAEQSPYNGNMTVPFFFHAKKLSSSTSPDIISVNLTAGTEYTAEFSKNLCEAIKGLEPDIRVFDPNDKEVNLNALELSVYPEEDPSIVCLTFKPEISGTYEIEISNAGSDDDDDDDGYVFRIYNELRNPDNDNEAGYPVHYTVSDLEGNTSIANIEDIIHLRRLLIADVEEYDDLFKLMPKRSTDEAEENFKDWFKSILIYFGLYDELMEKDGTSDVEAANYEDYDEEYNDEPTVGTAADEIDFPTSRIEPELTGIPYSDNYRSLGTGISAITNLRSANSTAFRNLPELAIPKNPREERKFSYKFISTQEELEQEMGSQAGLSLGGNALGLTSSSSSNYKFGLTSTTLIIRYSVLEKFYRELDEGDAVDCLRSGAKSQAKRNVDRFRENYGDYYVAGYRYGGFFEARLTITTNTTEEIKRVKNGFSLSLPGDGEYVSSSDKMVSSDFTNTNRDLLRNNNATIDLEIVMLGAGNPTYSNPEAGQPIKQENISNDETGEISGDVGTIGAGEKPIKEPRQTSDDNYAALDRLVLEYANFTRLASDPNTFTPQSYVPVYVLLKRYRDLDDDSMSELPAKIPVPTKHALLIQRLNRQVMNMRGYHNIIVNAGNEIDPDVASDYKDQVQTILDTISLGGNDFYNSMDAMNRTLPKIVSLNTKLKALGDRYTFYKMLMTARNNQIARTGQGRYELKDKRGVSFGYKSMLISKAVTEDINASGNGGELYNFEVFNTDWTTNPAPGFRWNSSLYAGTGNIICYFKFSSDNLENDKYCRFDSPAIMENSIGFDCWSGNSRTYGFRFHIMPLKFDRSNYPFEAGMNK